MLILLRFDSRTKDQLPSPRTPIQTRNELERIDPDRLICISHLLQPRFLSILCPPSLRFFLSVSLVANYYRLEIKRLQSVRRQIPFVLIPSWIRPGISPSFLSSFQIVSYHHSGCLELTLSRAGPHKRINSLEALSGV